MIEKLQALATECNRLSSGAITVTATLEPVGIQIIAQRNGVPVRAAFLISWGMLANAPTMALLDVVRGAAARV